MTSLCMGLLRAVNGAFAYLKNSMKEKPYPCCSAMPAHTTLADAPISVPFPKQKREESQRKLLNCFLLLPSKQIMLQSWTLILNMANVANKQVSVSETLHCFTSCFKNILFSILGSDWH